MNKPFFKSIINSSYQSENDTKYSYITDLIYPFTTENINGYLSFFDLDNKSLLTVGSSGDQILNALLKNAKEITHIDLNPYSKFYYYLKAAAILSLNQSEFLKHFYSSKNNFIFRLNYQLFNYSTFEKIKDALKFLDYDSYLFWNEIFTNKSLPKVRKTFFSTDQYNAQTVQKLNNYLFSEENYNLLKKQIVGNIISFITGSIQETELPQKYDNIWLSNICQYMQKNDQIIKILEKYKNYLNDNGKLLLAYLYGINQTTTYNSSWSKVYDLKTLFSYPEMKDVKIDYIIGLILLREKTKQQRMLF